MAEATPPTVTAEANSTESKPSDAPIRELTEEERTRLNTRIHEEAAKKAQLKDELKRAIQREEMLAEFNKLYDTDYRFRDALVRCGFVQQNSRNIRDRPDITEEQIMLPDEHTLFMILVMWEHAQKRVRAERQRKYLARMKASSRQLPTKKEKAHPKKEKDTESTTATEAAATASTSEEKEKK
jgi:hypothetical protein